MTDSQISELCRKFGSNNVEPLPMGGVFLLRDCKHFFFIVGIGHLGESPPRCDGKSNSVTSKVRFSGLDAVEGATLRRNEAGMRRGRSESMKELERWFSEQLSRLYGEILSEPLPDELADLVQQLRRDKKSTVRKPT